MSDTNRAARPSFPFALWFFTWVLVVMMAILMCFIWPFSFLQDFTPQQTKHPDTESPPTRIVEKPPPDPVAQAKVQALGNRMRSLQTEVVVAVGIIGGVAGLFVATLVYVIACVEVAEEPPTDHARAKLDLP